jgi:hypothetical protein
MGKKILLFVCSQFLLAIFLFAEKAEIPKIYSQIKDIYHPTNEDYKIIQKYLASPERQNIEQINDSNYIYVAQNFKIIGDIPTEQPMHGMLPVNSDMKTKENCVILYSSFNRRYPRGLIRQLSEIKKSDFKGHILYRIGGWPDAEGGSLVLAHVPYAFKTSFFNEAKRLGYKRFLWIDSSVVPLVSLNKIFKIIEEKGFFVMGNSHMVGPYMNEKTAKSFGLTLEDTFKIPSCSGAIFGFDFSNEKAAKVIDLFHKAAQDKDAYYSARGEQNALSIILFQNGITELTSVHFIPESKEEIKPDSLFLLDRSFVY